MQPLDDRRLEILHAHYRDTCAGLQGFRSQRDKGFYWIVGLLVLVLYDAYAPQSFGLLVGAVLKQKAGLETTPDLRYLSSLLLLILLGLVLRYCQAVVYLERQYKYVHALEELLAAEYGGLAFTREGRFYLGDYPTFANWAHYLYTLLFPCLLIIAVVLRSVAELRSGWPWPGLVWLDILIGVGLLVTMGFYLNAIREWPKRKKAGT